jgi:hypothetical protein
MKKITLLAVAFVAISFASCKKDRVCTCTTTTPAGTSVDKTTYFEAKKKDARLFCIGNQTETTAGGSTVTGNKTTCELK